MKKGFIILWVFALQAVLTAYGAKPITFPGREAASVGIYIENLETGDVVADHNSAVALTPASILKSLTAATSLLTLGKDFQYRTDFILLGTDPQSGAADMIIIGGGDPTMGGRDFEASGTIPDIIANRLTELGIDRIQGEVKIDGSVLPEGGGVVPGWEVEDITESYGAGLFPINWMDNYFARWALLYHTLFPASTKIIIFLGHPHIMQTFETSRPFTHHREPGGTHCGKRKSALSPSIWKFWPLYDDHMVWCPGTQITRAVRLPRIPKIWWT